MQNPNPFLVSVKPETTGVPPGYLPPGYEWPGNPDGVKRPGEPWWKIPIPETIPGTNIPWPDVPVTIGPDGRPTCHALPCNIPFPPFAPHQPDDVNDPIRHPDWQLPPELGPLPGIRPIPPPGRGDSYPVPPLMP